MRLNAKQVASASDVAIEELMAKHALRPIGVSATVLDVITRIEALIGDGTLSPGERLVEADLCNLLDASRGPVREALRVLAGDGVIELVVNRGARVRRLRNKEIYDRSIAVSAIYCAGIEQFVIQEQKLFDPGMALLRHLAKKIHALGADSRPLSFIDLISQYHVVINHFSGNEYLNTMVARMHVRHFQKQLSIVMNPYFLKNSGARYRDITEAIAERNAPKAIKLTRSIEEVIAEEMN